MTEENRTTSKGERSQAVKRRTRLLVSDEAERFRSQIRENLDAAGGSADVAFGSG